MTLHWYHHLEKVYVICCKSVGILFNPLKSQCLFLCKCKTLCSPYSLLFKGNYIEFVDFCKLLGVIMSRNITDRHMYSAVHGFYRKRNDVLYDFASLTSHVKFSLFSTYCLWDYSDQYDKHVMSLDVKLTKKKKGLYYYTTHCDTFHLINTCRVALKKI